MARWRNRRMWPLALEGTGSLLWVVCWALAIVLAVVDQLSGHDLGLIRLGFAWGIAIAIVATVQLSIALTIEHPYDRRAALAFFAGPLYPLAYWAISSFAALRSEVSAVLGGPRSKRVVWDIPREGA